ncbi:MAG: hypothetical protein ABI068_06275 [Ktedonobacterales bacterium]
MLTTNSVGLLPLIPFTQGQHIALHDATRLALESHFTPVSDDIIQSLDQADAARLRDVLAHIGVETLEQLHARIEQQP